MKNLCFSIGAPVLAAAFAISINLVSCGDGVIEEISWEEKQNMGGLGLTGTVIEVCFKPGVNPNTNIPGTDNMICDDLAKQDGSEPPPPPPPPPPSSDSNPGPGSQSSASNPSTPSSASQPSQPSSSSLYQPPAPSSSSLRSSSSAPPPAPSSSSVRSSSSVAPPPTPSSSSAPPVQPSSSSAPPPPSGGPTIGDGSDVDQLSELGNGVTLASGECVSIKFKYVNQYYDGFMLKLTCHNGKNFSMTCSNCSATSASTNTINLGTINKGTSYNWSVCVTYEKNNPGDNNTPCQLSQ